ncbi:MAG: glycoside hydrolase family 2 protein [Victivallaceae bacterium]
MFNAYPHYPSRREIQLPSLWDFAFAETTAELASPVWEELQFNDAMAVPGVFDTAIEAPARRGVGFYRTRFDARPGATLQLKIGGLGLKGAIFADRKLIGIDDLPYSGLSYFFTPEGGGVHELVIAVDNRLDFTPESLFAQFYDYYGHGGIYREVTLHELPENAIDRVRVETLDETGNVRLTVLFHQPLNGKIEAALAINGSGAAPLSLEVINGKAMLEKHFRLPYWSDETPHLHTLELATANDRVVERFGLRTVRTADGQILLNGRPVILRGYCRHESHPLFGPALPPQQIREDVALLKQLNCNFVRGSHYPQSQLFLDLCDQYGILVWEEGIGWGDREDRLCNRRFNELQLAQLAPMVHNSFNHPAVIIYGVLNEGDSKLPAGREIYRKLLTELRRLDSSRLVTFASMFPREDINFDLVDIVSINMYPGWYAADSEQFRPLGEIQARIDELGSMLKDNPLLRDKPFIISEIGAGAIYGWRDRFAAHWSEEYQRDYLETVCEIFRRDHRIAGLALWQFCDGRTYSSSRALGRPRAFNNKGTFDEYRRPKLAFDTVRKIFGEMKNSGRLS